MERVKFFKSELLKIFPGLDLDLFKYGNDIEWHNFHFNIPACNKNLKNSPYFFKPKNLVHFTNREALCSILQGQSLRLYNLYNLDDHRECPIIHSDKQGRMAF